MKRLVESIIVVTVVTMLFVRCFKDEAYDTQVVINPYQQIYDGADATALAGVVGYAFEADTADISILSYDDALIGRVVSRETGDVVPQIAVSEAYSGEGADADGASLAMQIRAQYVSLLLVDTLNKDYAYTYYEVGMNLPQLFMYLVFRPWYEGTATSGKWVYVVPEANGEVDPDEIPTVTE